MKSCEGEIFVGAWGGPNGNAWRFKAKRSGIKEIIIRHGGVIDSIIFKGYDAADEASTADDHSVKFGGRGGNRTEKICIDFPSEFLTGISGTHGRWGKFPDLITSLKLHTNQTEYGPFGKGSGHPFSFNAEGGVVTGFHGREGSYLDAIGVFIKPVCSVYKTVSIMKQQYSDMIIVRSSPGPLSPSPRGPNWGSTIDCDRHWDDDGVAVKEVSLNAEVDESLELFNELQLQQYQAVATKIKTLNDACD